MPLFDAAKALAAQRAPGGNAAVDSRLPPALCRIPLRRPFPDPLTQAIMTTPQRRHDDDELSIWIVYEDPPDFPNQYVARRHRGYIVTGEYVTGNTLVDVRAKLPPGLMRIERSAGDDPMIRESWI